MASSIMHLAITSELTKHFDFSDIDRLKFGVVLPDAGKDRTGVISALILWLCGVRKSDIVYDYMRTKENDKQRFELIHQNFPELNMNIVIPNENNMTKFMEMIEDGHGSVQNYFSSIGITAEIKQRLCEKLCHA